MVAPWIERKAEEYRQREREAQIERELKLRGLDIINSRWREIKDSLETVVRKNVEEWNAAFPQNEKKIDGVFRDVVDGFRIKKAH